MRPPHPGPLPRIGGEGTAVTGQPSPWFDDYPPDFFAFIVIDECHRGGANDESTWRAILNYYSPAVQLGLTATPKRKDNVNTYACFGDPVFTWFLKEDIIRVDISGKLVKLMIPLESEKGGQDRTYPVTPDEKRVPE